MAYLILIRHSTSQPIPGQSAHTWQLTPAAHDLIDQMAGKLRNYNIAHIYTSAEPKIEATGKRLASVLDIPCDVTVELHETLRETAPYYEKIEDFWAAIQLAMEQPDQLLFGEETFDAAYERMACCLDELLSSHSGQTIAAVTGGVTLSLVVSRKAGKDVYKIWRSLNMPSYAVLKLPDYELVELVTEMN